MFSIAEKRIAIVGLGYVGWPLAQAFGSVFDVVGYDHDSRRIKELLHGFDRTQSVDNMISPRLQLTDQEVTIAACNIYVLTVPTPVDEAKRPDLKPLLTATRMVGAHLKSGDIVIYESTVYPGCTEEDCVPILEEASGLKFNVDFYCGYSPERISPGDHLNTLKTIVKVTSGSTPEVAQFVDTLYKSIISAGTHLAPSIRVAEAAKAIENSQRDLNISFVNELALLFDRMQIDTHDVLEAASTKWNFLNFKPGLVGGHCIGVDPYYLVHKAEQYNYIPQVILSGRRINEEMAGFVAANLVKLILKKNEQVDLYHARILLLGITYKENCPDTRNSSVVRVYNELKQYRMIIDVYDPWANADDVWENHQIKLVDLPSGIYDGILLAVAHDEFRQIDFSILRSKTTAVYDLKSILPREGVDKRL